MNFFSFQNTFQHRTYFNGVNVGRNILMNSQLENIIFMSSDKK